MERMKSLYGKYREIINYLIVGVLTTVVSLSVYYLCVCTFLDPQKPVQLHLAHKSLRRPEMSRVGRIEAAPEDPQPHLA